jgi:hypothetical protein
VVPGRADEREAAAVGRRQRAAGAEQRRLVARLRGDRVGIEHGRHLEGLEPVEVGGRVAALYLFTRGGPAFDHLEGVQQHEQAFPRLDVRFGRVELGECGVADELRRSTQL